MACGCGDDAERKLLYACSGAANTGLLADRVWRALKRDGLGDATCLAGMGAELSGFLESARSSGGNVVLDGCKVACGAKIFEKHGIPYAHFVMTDYDVVKNKTPITESLAESVAERIAKQL